MCYNVITIKEGKPVRLRYKRMMNYTLTIKTTRGQREMGFVDAATAYATFDFYAGDKKAFGIREVILIDEDALKMVIA